MENEEGENEHESGFYDDSDEEEIEISDEEEDEASESQDSRADSTEKFPAGDGNLDGFFHEHANPFATDDDDDQEPLENSPKNTVDDDEKPSDAKGCTIQRKETMKNMEDESTLTPTAMSDQIDALQKKIWQAKKELTAKNFGLSYSNDFWCFDLLSDVIGCFPPLYA